MVNVLVEQMEGMVETWDSILENFGHAPSILMRTHSLESCQDW